MQLDHAPRASRQQRSAKCSYEKIVNEARYLPGNNRLKVEIWRDLAALRIVIGTAARMRHGSGFAARANHPRSGWPGGYHKMHLFHTKKDAVFVLKNIIFPVFTSVFSIYPCFLLVTVRTHSLPFARFSAKLLSLRQWVDRYRPALRVVARPYTTKPWLLRCLQAARPG